MAPPPIDSEWDVRFGTAEAVKGWEELGQKAAGNTRRVFDALRSDPGPEPETGRQHRLGYMPEAPLLSVKSDGASAVAAGQK